MTRSDPGCPATPIQGRKRRLALVLISLAVLAACVAFRYFWGAESASAEPGDAPVAVAPEPAAGSAPAASAPVQPGGAGLKIVATVNGEDISREELAKECLRHYGQQVLEALQHKYLIMLECQKNGVEFLTSVFDLKTLDFLATLGMKRIKIPSPDADSWTLIDKCLDCFDEALISVGMSTDEELNRLLSYIATKQMQYKTVIMHCVSEYPAPAKNMWRIKWLRDMGFRPGYSDHTLGTDAAKLAIDMGAEYVEKHFTLSRFLPGNDQPMSGTIEEFKEICSWRDRVRDMVKMVPVEPKNTHYRGKWGDNA